MAYSLEEMEEYLRNLYKTAGEELVQKAAQYMLDFQRLEEQHKRDVQNGKWTQEQFDTWRKNKLLYGTHWTRMIQTVQRDMAKVNQTALDYINGKIPQIFAQTYNEVAEKVPKSPVSGYSFELVNADTVKNLIHEEGIILPPKKNLDKQKDKLWNAKQVNAQLLQGILQGESIKKIAARMQNVANADLVGATRTARTMCTAAENSGRQSAYNRAAEDGIKFTKTWVAALQGNTRDTHKYLNQQTQPHDKPFESSSGAVLMFPGDWHAPPAEVYNCRCTMITNFKGFDKVKLKEAVERQQKEAEERNERPRDYIERLQSEILESSANWEGMTEEETQIIIDSIANCPEYLAEVIRQTLPNVRIVVSDTNPHGCTCYSPTENVIYILRENVNSPDFAESFWHEYLHYIDTPQNSKSSYKQVDIFRKRVWLRDENGEVVYIDGKPQKTEETETYTREGITSKLARGGDYNARYQQAVVNDMNRLLDKLGLSEYYEMRLGVDEYSDQMLWNRQTNEIIDTTCMEPEDLKRLYGSMKDYMNEVTGINTARNYIYDLGYPRAPKREDYLEGYYTPKRHQYKEKEKYKGAEDDYRQARLEAYRKQDEWEKNHDMAAIEAEIKRLEHEAAVKAKLYGFATDSLDGAVNGALVSQNLPGGGHSAVYYMFNNNAIREEIANVGSAEATQNSEVINAMRNEMPEIYDLIKEVLRDVN